MSHGSRTSDFMIYLRLYRRIRYIAYDPDVIWNDERLINLNLFQIVFTRIARWIFSPYSSNGIGVQQIIYPLRMIFDTIYWIIHIVQVVKKLVYRRRAAGGEGNSQPRGSIITRTTTSFPFHFFLRSISTLLYCVSTEKQLWHHDVRVSRCRLYAPGPTFLSDSRITPKYFRGTVVSLPPAY